MRSRPQRRRERHWTPQNASPVEQALINAVNKRFANPPPLDRQPLDKAYAAAMLRAWQAFPDDPDVSPLTAKAISHAGTLDIWPLPDDPSRPLRRWSMSWRQSWHGIRAIRTRCTF